MNKDVSNQINEVSLKEYIETKIGAVEKATTIASANLEKRLEGMNEFRAQLKDQSNTFLTRAEHQSYTEKVDSDIRVLRESKATLEGKASQKSVNLSTILAVIGITIAFISLVHTFAEKSTSATIPVMSPQIIYYTPSTNNVFAH